jgi:hypothetical protein
MHRVKLFAAACAVAAAASLFVLHGTTIRRASDRAPARADVSARAPAPEHAIGLPARQTPPDLAALTAEIARRAEAREEALRAAVLRIGEDETLSLDARLERYREALEAHRAEAPETALLASPSMQAEIFLRMEGVQRELAALSPSARSGELAHIRRELGFDDGQIARMEEVDDRRQARWDNGLAYMQERARAVATFEGDALDAELHSLREEYFAHEAETIAAEERDGFFRFERPRIYGRN